ncbi:MAG: hypothetical protein GX489_03440 [Firmicutes bacterium]|nr:hypothetical protein [Bacillota bacterium]
MKFCFRLARVLKVKTIWEDQAKLKLAAAVVAREREEQLLEKKAAYLYNAWTELTAPGEKKVQQLASNFLLTDMANSDYKRQQAKVQVAQAAWETAQAEFVQRRSQRQVLTRLKEKKQVEFWQDINRTEQKELDEIASIFHLTGQRGCQGGQSGNNT